MSFENNFSHHSKEYIFLDNEILLNQREQVFKKIIQKNYDKKNNESLKNISISENKPIENKNNIIQTDINEYEFETPLDTIHAYINSDFKIGEVWTHRFSLANDKITKISTMSAYELGKNSKNKIPKIPIVKLRPRILSFENKK